MYRVNRVRPPQFRLATIFLAIATLCFLLATFRVFSPTSLFAAALFGLAVFAHVAGNVIGARLRAEGDRSTIESSSRSADLHRSQEKVQPRDFAPNSQLRERVSMGRVMFVAGAIGAAGGAALGGTLLAAVDQDPLTPASLVVGAGAFSVIGAFVGFLGSSFLGVLSSAVFQAQRDVPPRRKD